MAAPTTWADLLKYAPQISGGGDSVTYNGSNSSVNVPGIGKVVFAGSPDQVTGASVYGADNSMQYYTPQTWGGYKSPQQVQADTKNNDWTNSALGPMAALGIPALASAAGAGILGGFGTSGVTGGLETMPGTTAGLAGSGITDEMLLTGQAGLGDLGVGTGTAAGWSGFGDALSGTGALSSLNDLAKSPAGMSAIQKILSGNAGMQDWLSLLGPAMSVGSGLYGLDKAKDLTGVVDSGIGDATGTAGNALAKLNGISLDPNAWKVDQGLIDKADPWSASGGRSLADQQLQALMKSPGSLLTDPGYEARMMGTDRTMAAQGQLGGGGGAVAAANASGDYYSQRLKDLAGLETMGNPVGAVQTGISAGNLGLEGQKSIANLGATQAQGGLDAAKIGLDAAKLKLAAAGGANTLAGQSLASIGYGVTQATGGTTQMSQIQALLKQLQSSGNMQTSNV